MTIVPLFSQIFYLLIFKLQVLSHTFWSKIPQSNHSGAAKRVVKVQLPGGKVVTFALRRRSLILLACAGAIRYPYIEGNGQTPYHQVVRITIRIVDVSKTYKKLFFGEVGMSFP